MGLPWIRNCVKTAPHIFGLNLYNDFESDRLIDILKLRKVWHGEVHEVS